MGGQVACPRANWRWWFFFSPDAASNPHPARVSNQHSRSPLRTESRAMSGVDWAENARLPSAQLAFPAAAAPSRQSRGFSPERVAEQLSGNFRRCFRAQPLTIVLRHAASARRPSARAIVAPTSRSFFFSCSTSCCPNLDAQASACICRAKVLPPVCNRPAPINDLHSTSPTNKMRKP